MSNSKIFPFPVATTKKGKIKNNWEKKTKKTKKECDRKLQEAEDVFKMKLQDKVEGMQKLLERESQRCQG